MSVQCFTADELVLATGGELLVSGTSGAVCTDTRALSPGDWFLALVGDRFDGHRFLDVAQEAGAAGCIISQKPPHFWEGGVVRVPDTLRALQDLGRASRERLGGPVVGITGSSGKTTTRGLVVLALSSLGDIHQTSANLNNHIGVPLTLLAMEPEVSAAVVELGTSSPGEIAVLADIARPSVRLLVNVGPAHLEELGGLDGVAREKGALFRSAGAGDVVVVNLDDERVAAIPIPDGVRRVTYGRAEGAHIRLVDAKVDGENLSTMARWQTPVGLLEARFSVPGVHLAVNGAGALAVAWALDLDLVAAAAAMQSYAPVGMRLATEELPGGITVINDAYNANPDSMASSLQTLSQLSGRRVAVLGDMLELGHDEARWHQRTAALAGELQLELVVLVGPRMSAAASSCVGAGKVLAEPSPCDAVAPLRCWLKPGDRVLFKGSRGARVERVLQMLRGGVP